MHDAFKKILDEALSQRDQVPAVTQELSDRFGKALVDYSHEKLDAGVAVEVQIAAHVDFLANLIAHLNYHEPLRQECSTAERAALDNILLQLLTGYFERSLKQAFTIWEEETNPQPTRKAKSPQVIEINSAEELLDILRGFGKKAKPDDDASGSSQSH